MFRLDDLYDSLCPHCGRELDDDGDCGFCSEHLEDLSEEADREAR